MNQPSKGEERISQDEPEPIDEGGLRAPPELIGWRKAWWWFDFIILVKLARLRFIGILAVIGVVITQWDALVAYYDRYTRPAEAATVTASDVEWFCPMHPAVVRDNGKEKCPVCFMPLSKRKKGDGHEEALPPGVVNRVQLSPYRVVLAGVGTTEVDYLPLTKQISAVGFIEFNEREQRQVSAWVGGRIDRLYVNETGTTVEEGEVLADLYSPDLYSGMRELVTAVQSGSRQLTASSRERLRLLGISEDQLDELVKTGKANTHLKIRSPITGHIIEKYVVEGQYVETGMPLYDVADLSTVWIQAQVYEDDFPFLPQTDVHKPLPVGSPDALPVTATSYAFPNEPFRGALSFIYPHVDQQTRTLTIRCELNNPGHKLKPGTTATVTIDVPPRELEMFVHAFADDAERAPKLDEGLVLAVPESSVIDTGARRVVYRQTQPGLFEGIQVDLGPRMTGPGGAMYFPVLDGLQRGERVVTAGSFLVDAETRLNPAAGSVYFGGSGGATSAGSSVTTVRPSTPEDPDAKIEAALARLSSADRTLAEAQRYCPILKNNRLGSMGPPVKLDVAGETVFVCCEACKPKALGDPQATLSQAATLRRARRTDRRVAKGAAPSAATPSAKPANAADSQATLAEVKNLKKIEAGLAKLSADDRKAAEAQRFCAVETENRLGSMGKPVKLVIEGQAVFLCCAGCVDAAKDDPSKTLAKANQLKTAKYPYATHPEADASGSPDARSLKPSP